MAETKASFFRNCVHIDITLAELQVIIDALKRDGERCGSQNTSLLTRLSAIHRRRRRSKARTTRGLVEEWIANQGHRPFTLDDILASLGLSYRAVTSFPSVLELRGDIERTGTMRAVRSGGRAMLYLATDQKGGDNAKQANANHASNRKDDAGKAGRKS